MNLSIRTNHVLQHLQRVADLHDMLPQHSRTIAVTASEPFTPDVPMDDPRYMEDCRRDVRRIRRIGEHIIASGTLTNLVTGARTPWSAPLEYLDADTVESIAEQARDAIYEDPTLAAPAA